MEVKSSHVIYPDRCRVWRRRSQLKGISEDEKPAMQNAAGHPGYAPLPEIMHF